MNGEDQNLTLGAVEPTAQEQALPELSISEYLGRLREMGIDDAESVQVMARNGYDSQSVYNEMVSQYETQREEYLRLQEEAKKRQEDSDKRIEAMSVQAEAEKKKGRTFRVFGYTIRLYK